MSVSSAAVEAVRLDMQLFWDDDYACVELLGEDEKLLAKGTARRHPTDKPNDQIGILLATTRCRLSL